MRNHAKASFRDYRKDGHLWITLSTGEYYPDVLPFACELYKPVLVTFGQLLKSAHSSTNLFLSIADTDSQWMRIHIVSSVQKICESGNSRRNAQKEICGQEDM